MDSKRSTAVAEVVLPPAIKLHTVFTLADVLAVGAKNWFIAAGFDLSLTESSLHVFTPSRVGAMRTALSVLLSANISV